MGDGDAVRVTRNEAQQQFEALDGAAVLTYDERDGKLMLLHTGVPDEHEGHGVGAALVQAALEHARAAGERVVPFCSFAAAWIARHPEWADITDEP